MNTIGQIISHLNQNSESWVTRFAPSPTGYLHLGHIAAAGFVWAIGRGVKAKIYLRIEDHDEGRCRPEYVSAIKKDLEWLGFKVDKTLPLQSERKDRYLEVFKKLMKRDLIYKCTCSRKDIQSRSANLNPSELWYDGHCLEHPKGFHEVGNYRVKVNDSSFEFHDLFKGKMVQTPREQCGDFVICDRYGYWSYHFANVIDDHDQKINLIIRGEDILPSTGRHIYLRQLLKLSPIDNYAHHSLVFQKDGVKISKRQKAVSITQYREQGYSSEWVLAEAARQIGLPFAEDELSLSEFLKMLENFDWSAGTS